jgi:hypothetical protein
MNILSVVSIIVGALYLVGFGTLVYCAKWAPEGYEDVDGFHLGNKPGAVIGGEESRAANFADALKQANWQTSAPF